MEPKKAEFNVFALVALMVITCTVFIFWKYYFSRDFVVFTTEEEIAEGVTSEFPYLVEYLFADYLL